jgi:tetratricopeptide (TPR) repeat protein
MPSAVSEKTLALLNKAKPLLEKAWTLSDANWKQAPGYYAKYLDFYLETLLQEQETQIQLTQNVRIASKYVSTPLETIAYSQMAQMYKKMGDRTKGLEFQLLDVMRKVLESDKEVRAWCDKTLAADPKHLGANYTMFQLSQSAGQFNTAIEYIDRCLAQLQNKDDIWIEYTIQKSQVLLQAFFKTSDKKYLDGGVVLYESILAALENNTSHPKRAMILNNLAFLLADNNQQLDKAVEYARRALKDAPSDPIRMDTLAYTLAKSNLFEEAEKMGRMSIQQYELEGKSVPWDGYYHLGMALEGLQKKPDAKAAYQKALDTGGDAIPAPDKEQLATAVKRVSQ